MKKPEALLEDNRIIHYLMSELNGEADEAAEEWKNWANIIDQERVSRMLCEMYTGMLVAEGKCTEFGSKNYINQQIKEYRAMNANEIKAGSKQRIKIGKNEVEVTAIEQTATGWTVESASGKRFPVSESRFIKAETVEPPAERIEIPDPHKPKVSGLKPRVSMLDAAAEVMKDALRPMSAKELIAAMEKAGHWKSPAGNTPHCSLSAAIFRELKHKENPRFKKTGRGLFALADEA